MKFIIHFLAFLVISAFASPGNLDESAQIQEDNVDEIRLITEEEDDDLSKPSFFSQLEDVFSDLKDCEYSPFTAYSAGFQMAKSVEEAIPGKPDEMKMCQMITAQRAVRNLVSMLHLLLDTMPRVEDEDLLSLYKLQISAPMKDIYHGFLIVTRTPSKSHLKDAAAICDMNSSAGILDNFEAFFSRTRYIFYQSQMDDYEYEPFKKLMKLWNQLLKHATIMAGICDALTIDENRFAAVQQPVLHNIENLMKEQRSFIRNSCYGQSSDRICQKGYWPNTVRAFLHEELMEMNEDDVDVVVLAELRDELNHKYQDMDMFTLIMVPIGLFQSQKFWEEHILHYSNRHGLHIIVYRSAPSNTFIPLEKSSPELAKVNFEPLGTLGIFDTNPLCVYPTSYYKFHDVIKAKCAKEGLFCLISGGPGVTVATTNAHLFIKNFKVSCKLFAKEKVYLFVGLKPDNKTTYDSVPAVNANLKSKKRLHNAIINISEDVY